MRAFRRRIAELVRGQALTGLFGLLVYRLITASLFVMEGHRGAVGPNTFTHGRSPILSTRMQMNAGGLDRAGHEAGSDVRPSLRVVEFPLRAQLGVVRRNVEISVCVDAAHTPAARQGLSVTRRPAMRVVVASAARTSRCESIR